MTIVERVQAVRERLASACARSGRSITEVTLIAATKTRTVQEVAAVLAAGVTDLGENYVQELLAKRTAIDRQGGLSVSWHIIGHLQRNKVKYVVPGVALIHSLDSLRLAQEIDRQAARAERRQPVLLEVNIAGEDSKTGVAPAQVGALAAEVAQLPHLELQGLMCMPPYSHDPEASRPHFQALAALAELLAANLPPGAMRHLSMGMSGDYEVAAEEGATLVRLGKVLFGPRPERASS